jgi:hypothetical protein
MSSTRASQMTKSSCCRQSSVPCTNFTRRGGDLLGAALSAVTPPTSSPTAPRGRSSTPPPINMTTPSGTTTRRTTKRRSTASGTRRRRSYRRLCPERVLPSATLTSSMMTHPAQRRMRSSSASRATSPAFTSWASLRETSSTLM